MNIDVSTIERGLYHFETRRPKTMDGTIYEKGDTFSISSTDMMKMNTLRRILVLTQPPSSSFRLLRVEPHEIQAVSVEAPTETPKTPPTTRRKSGPKPKTATA